MGVILCILGYFLSCAITVAICIWSERREFRPPNPTSDIGTWAFVGIIGIIWPMVLLLFTVGASGYLIYLIAIKMFPKKNPKIG